jgi:riboflavin transporter FmnP
MRDAIATVLVVAIGVPYVGYLMDGEMPFLQDARGMSALGLILGAVAFLVLRGGNAKDKVGIAENALASLALVLGLLALALAETAAAEVMLAVFMGSILLVWATEVADHAGWVPGHATASSHA